MKKGDIVLVSFPFTDFSAAKIRPALVLSVCSHDVIIAFISTQLHRREETDVDLLPTKGNRLKKISIVRLTKLATVEKKIILGLLGVVSEHKINEVNDNLKKIFQIR